MKPIESKMKEALNEAEKSCEKVKSLVSAALADEVGDIREDILAELSDMYGGITGFLRYVKDNNISKDLCE